MFKPKISLKNIANHIKQIYKGRYFYPALVMIGFCLVTFAVLYIGSAPFLAQLKEGDISLRTVYAPYNFTYPTSVDEEKTEKVRKEFEDKIDPLYEIDMSVQEKAFAELDTFFDSVEEAQENANLDNKEKVEYLKRKTEFPQVSEKDLSRFLELKDPNRIRKITKDALENIFLVGVVDEADKEGLLQRSRLTLIG